MLKGFVRCLTVVWLGLLMSVPALAVQVEGLFESEELVADQSAEQRTVSVKAGLAEVLIRASGHEQVLEHEVVQKMLDQPDAYLAQFSYRTNDKAVESDASALRLMMRFDPASVIRALDEAGLPVWGSNRPNVLVWLAIQGPNGRFVVNNENNPLLAEVLATEAKRRGVPVLLPLMDLEDEQLISVSDIWGQFSDRVGSASVRYSPDATFTGRFYRSGDGWQAYWVLKNGGQREVIEVESEGVRGLFAKSVDALAEALAAKYAVVTTGARSGSYVFKVLGLKSVEDYAALNRYLSNLQIVAGLAVAQLDDAAVTYQVELNGGVEQFLSVVALDSHLEPDRGGAVGAEQRFFWRP